MTDDDLTSGQLYAGALVHYRGIPFYLAADVQVIGSWANVKDAAELAREAGDKANKG